MYKKMWYKKKKTLYTCIKSSYTHQQVYNETLYTSEGADKPCLKMCIRKIWDVYKIVYKNSTDIIS